MRSNYFRKALISNVLVGIYIALAIFTMVAMPIQVALWNRTPFLGGFLNPAMRFVQVRKITPGADWPANNFELGLETQLLAVNGQETQDAQALDAVLDDFQVGEVVTLTVQQNSQTSDLNVRLGQFSFYDKLVYLYLPLFAALLTLLISIWAFSDQVNRPLSHAVALFAASLSLFFNTYFDFLTLHQYAGLLYLSIGMMAGSLIQVAILLPRRKSISKQMYWISMIGFPHNILLSAIGIYSLRFAKSPTLIMTILVLMIISIGLSVITLLGSFFALRARNPSPLVERQTDILIGVTLASFLPLLIQISLNLLSNNQPYINPFFFLPMAILPASYFFLSRRFTLPDKGNQFIKIGINVGFAIGFALIYTLIYIVLDLMLLVRVQPNNPLLAGVMIFLIVILLTPLQKWVESTFDAGRRSILFDHETLAVEYATALSSSNSKQNAILIFSDVMQEIASPDEIQIFMYDQESGGYAQIIHSPNDKTEEAIIPVSSALPNTFKSLNSSLFLEADSTLNNDIRSEFSQNQDDVTFLHIPILGNYGLLGWISIANQSHRQTYIAKDINLLESLAAQFALVYERSDTIDSLNARLKEMQIINHIAIAINNQTDFDQLLLSIYRSIQEVIKIDRLSLILKQEQSDSYQRHFLFMDDAVKISTQNPQSLAENFPERVAIQTNVSVLATVDDVAWLFIPLATENEIIGVLSLGSPKDQAGFERTVLSLADSISSLTTGAIIKSRLLAASRARMRHLRKINEVSQELTSTLSVEPLLELVVDNAMEILNSTSSALLILDKNDESLVFSVVNGPVSEKLLGKRLPKNEGIAGEAYRTQQSVIRNNIQKEELHFWGEHPQINNQITSIMAVPLVAGNEIIGILEVMNKENEQDFDADDKIALEGFASQAAIALFNAELYSKTDSALEKRVAELYTMQQIDERLHSSRELNQTLQTTLSAALTYTKNKCGTIMLVDTYYKELDDIWQRTSDAENFSKLTHFDLAAFPWFVENMEEPYEMVEEDANALSERLGLFPIYQAHMLIPTKLDDDLYSLIILHLPSADDINSQDVDFLLSLNSHAMIALQNAILYEELHDAVNAKNEFISFISHELKNPLTAIKGHADILAKGMVGEINEEQEDFLRTISHNVRRMNTFITDLADQSQIESKSLRLDFAPAEVHDIVNEVLQTYGQQIKAKSISVETDLQPDIPDVFCDRLRLIQVLSNLVSNAVKYTQEGGKVMISAEHAINEWDPKGAAEVVHFRVKDNGFGIDFEDQAYLFTKFFRGTNETILKISGTGLGLRISKSLTEMMGGMMWFESTPGEGSTFHITVPI